MTELMRSSGRRMMVERHLLRMPVMCSARPKGDTVIQELLAVVKCLWHFCTHPLGHHPIVCTDHGSLTWLRKFKNPENKLARWLDQLQEHEFEIVQRHSRKHSNIHVLQVPCKQCGVRVAY